MAETEAASEPLVLRQQRAGIVWLTLNRPARYNALSSAMIDALDAALESVAAEASARVVILGASGKAFCAGHDLRELRALDDAAATQRLFQRCADMMMRIQRLPQPVIARVQGLATAAGCQLVAMCDLAVAARSARFAVSGVSLGLFCAAPGVALARNLPRKKAMELLLTGDFIAADEAERLGLVNRAVPDMELDPVTLGLAETIAARPPAAVALGKQGFYRQIEQPMEAAFALCSEAMACNALAPETREGIDAFIEKRAPRWDGPEAD